jgi:hypothetical protein
MPRSSVLAAACLALHLAAAPAGAQGLECGGAAGGHLGADAACAALADLLAPKLAAGGLRVRLEITHDAPDLLAGRLLWQKTGGASGQGPVVEVSAGDRPLTPRAGRRLAEGLVAVSGLPD